MLITHQMMIDRYATLCNCTVLGRVSDLNRSLEYLLLMLCLCSGPQLMLFIVLTVSDLGGCHKPSVLFHHSYLTHLCRVDSSIRSLWTGPFPIKGVPG